MLLSQINYLAVAVSTVVYFLLGAIWYSKVLFAVPWAKANNISMDNPDRSGLGKMMALTFVSCFVIAIVCGYMMLALNSTHCMTGIKLGAILGVGFVATTYFINSLYIKKPFLLVMIDSGYHITGIILCCIILSVWR
jgi:hypothetical protein